MKRICIFDTEVYSNYFLLSMMNPETGNIIDMTHDNFDVVLLKKICSRYTFVGFNSINYDQVVLAAMVSGKFTTQQIKNLSDDIIKRDQKYWDLMSLHNLTSPIQDHIDIMPIAPGTGSLKARGVRLGFPKLQELPIHHTAILTDEEKEKIRLYCHNDLKVTNALYEYLIPSIETRIAMKDMFGFDCRSLSDAKIGEKYIEQKVAKRLGVQHWELEKPKAEDITFRYQAPDYLKFRSEVFQGLMQDINDATYHVPSHTKVKLPKVLRKYDPKLTEKKIQNLVDKEKYAELEALGVSSPEDLMPLKIGDMVYSVGLGGLHSTEKHVSHYSDDDYTLYDFDVRAYYPQSILNSGLFPKSLGTNFLVELQQLVSLRITAKLAGDKLTDAIYKIVINAIYGKLGSWHSRLFAPELMVSTCLTGQLSLLMLIEALEHREITVVSANTDGIVIKCHKTQEEKMRKVLKAWENRTNLVLEESEYKSTHNESVNSYLAVKTNGEIKGKGSFCDIGIDKNLAAHITTKAIRAYLSDKTPIINTIMGEDDIQEFILMRKVQGGAVDQNGQECGSIVRWYYAADPDANMRYKTSGNLVPKSTGAKPIPDLPDEFPEDIDYRRYISQCEKMMGKIGIVA